jgi:hypothetical protein
MASDLAQVPPADCRAGAKVGKTASCQGLLDGQHHPHQPEHLPCTTPCFETLPSQAQAAYVSIVNFFKKHFQVLSFLFVFFCFVLPHSC